MSSDISSNLPVPLRPLDPVPTAEDIAGSIKAAFDSVGLCNTLITKGVKNNETKTTIDRNKSHLQIMLGKTWFVDGLTPQQHTDIETCIANSEAFIT